MSKVLLLLVFVVLLIIPCIHALWVYEVHVGLERRVKDMVRAYEDYIVAVGRDTAPTPPVVYAAIFTYELEQLGIYKLVEMGLVQDFDYLNGMVAVVGHLVGETVEESFYRVALLDTGSGAVKYTDLQITVSDYTPYVALSGSYVYVAVYDKNDDTRHLYIMDADLNVLSVADIGMGFVRRVLGSINLLLVCNTSSGQLYLADGSGGYLDVLYVRTSPTAGIYDDLIAYTVPAAGIYDPAENAVYILLRYDSGDVYLVKYDLGSHSVSYEFYVGSFGNIIFLAKYSDMIYIICDGDPSGGTGVRISIVNGSPSSVNTEFLPRYAFGHRIIGGVEHMYNLGSDRERIIRFVWRTFTRTYTEEQVVYRYETETVTNTTTVTVTTSEPSELAAPALLAFIFALMLGVVLRR